MTFREAPLNTRAVLTIEGECIRPTKFSYQDLQDIHRYYQVDDLSTVDERLSGKGVRLRKLIDIVGPEFHTKYVTVESQDGAFSACLPLEEMSRTAILVYEEGGKPLAREAGGPVRFLVPFYPDKCANVKNAARLVISEKPREDTRPSNASEHAALHETEKQGA